MNLVKYGIAVAVGYHLGQPHGRRQLEQLRQQVIQLSKRPEVKRLQERGWDIAGEQALAAKNLASTTLTARKKKTVDPAGAATPVVDHTDPTPRRRTGGLRGRGWRAGWWRRPRPNPLSPITAADDAGTTRAPTTATAAATEVGAGFGGRTVAEDSEAVITGVSAPPPVGRSCSRSAGAIRPRNTSPESTST